MPTFLVRTYRQIYRAQRFCKPTGQGLAEYLQTIGTFSPLKCPYTYAKKIKCCSGYEQHLADNALTMHCSMIHVGHGPRGQEALQLKAINQLFQGGDLHKFIFTYMSYVKRTSHHLACLLQTRMIFQKHAAPHASGQCERQACFTARSNIVQIGHFHMPKHPDFCKHCFSEILLHITNGVGHLQTMLDSFKCLS
jgi:hypothetical protein